MATKKGTKGKKKPNGAKKTIKPKNGALEATEGRATETAAEDRAEAVETLEGLAPDARAEAVEPIEGAPPERASEPAPTPHCLDQALVASRLLSELGFALTGRAVEEIRPSALLCAAETWRDRKDRESRVAAEDVLACAGWFRPPAAAPVAASAPAPEPPAAPAAPGVDLEPLRARVETATAGLAAARDELRSAKAALAAATHTHAAGVGRGASVAERVAFAVELVGESVRISVKGRPETEELKSAAEVRAAINKTAYAYTDRHIGTRDVVGNKGGSLSNRLRAVLTGA